MKRLLIGSLVFVLVGMALVGGMSLAAAQGEDAPVQTFLGRVADKLGIGEDELRSAMTEAQQDIIDEQVAAGRLTPEQGERLKERIQEKGLLGPLDRFRIRDRACHRAGQLVVNEAATVLGMEPQDLVSELKDGKTLAEVAEEQGMSLEVFKADLLQAVRSRLDALVAEGKLTQEQADAIYDRLQGNIDDIVSGHPGRLLHRCVAGPCRAVPDQPPIEEAP